MASKKPTLQDHRKAQLTELAALMEQLANNMNIVAARCRESAADPSVRLHISEQESFINTVYLLSLQVLGRVLMHEAHRKTTSADLRQLHFVKLKAIRENATELTYLVGRIGTVLAQAANSGRPVPDMSRYFEKFATDLKSFLKEFGTITYLEALGHQSRPSTLLRPPRRR